MSLDFLPFHGWYGAHFLSTYSVPNSVLFIYRLKPWTFLFTLTPAHSLPSRRSFLSPLFTSSNPFYHRSSVMCSKEKISPCESSHYRLQSCLCSTVIEFVWSFILENFLEPKTNLTLPFSTDLKGNERFPIRHVWVIFEYINNWVSTHNLTCVDTISFIRFQLWVVLFLTYLLKTTQNRCLMMGRYS